MRWVPGRHFLLAAGAFTLATLSGDHTRVAPNGAGTLGCMAEGVDVSRHQGDIDWAAAKRGGIEFVYVKLTEGVGYTDPRADAHLRAARAAGVIVGGYHFARPDSNNPVAEGHAFAAALTRRGLAQPGALPPCLDMEKPHGIDLVAWSQRFLDTVRTATGYRPAMIYASTSWWNTTYRGGGWLDRDTWAWVAHYGRAGGNPGYKSARTAMHQYTDTGRIPGYGGNIDRNTSWVALSTLTGGTAATDPAPRPPATARPGLDDEETHMQLAPGTRRSASFDIPAGAKQIRVNCPMEHLIVHGIWQAGDALPAGMDFDYKWSHEKDFRVDRLRPWKIDVVGGATQGSIIYSYAPGNPERSGSLSFR